MIRLLLAEIPSIEEVDYLASIDHSLCKVFPTKSQYYQQEVNISSLVGHLMCEQLFFDLQIPAHELSTLHQSDLGKWQLKKSKVDFNISHSHVKVVVAASDEGKVGIDIEQIRYIPIVSYKDCFTPPEWQRIQQSECPERVFFDYWTKKESILKAWGLGLQIPLHQVSIENDIGRIGNTDMQGYFTAVPVTGYCCYLCTTFRVGTIDVEEFVLK